MPKTTPKKARNPKQPDPLKPIRAKLRAMDTKLNVCMNRAQQIMDDCVSIYTEVGKLHSINDKAISDAYELGQKSRLPAPEPKVTEPWVLKVGDWVVCEHGAGGSGAGWKPNGAVQIADFDTFDDDPIIKCDGKEYWFKRHNLRPHMGRELLFRHHGFSCW